MSQSSSFNARMGGSGSGSPSQHAKPNNDGSPSPNKKQRPDDLGISEYKGDPSRLHRTQVGVVLRGGVGTPKNTRNRKISFGLIDPEKNAIVGVSQLMGNDRCIDVHAAEDRIGTLFRFEFDSVVPGDIRYDFSINTGKSIFKVERPPVYSDDIFDGTRAYLSLDNVVDIRWIVSHTDRDALCEHTLCYTMVSRFEASAGVGGSGLTARIVDIYGNKGWMKMYNSERLLIDIFNDSFDSGDPFCIMASGLAPVSATMLVQRSVGDAFVLGPDYAIASLWRCLGQFSASSASGVHVLSDADFVIMHVSTLLASQTSLTTIGVYSSPSRKSLRQMLAALASIMIPAKEAGSIIAIMGDFNVHLDVLQGQGSETEDHNSSLLRAFMVGHEMVLKSTTAQTCDTGAMLDHVWVTGPHRRKYYKPKPNKQTYSILRTIHLID